MKQKSIIMHLDMNSYFASVEQQANPFLRHKPVGVCAYLSENGTIIASSSEAKALGVKTGCKAREAKRLIPDIVLIENEPAKYRCVTERIFKILSEYSEKMEPYSIDEAFLDLTGWVKNFDEAEKIAIEIKTRISNEVGEWLKCSVGIAGTKFLAKYAGDIAPKGGLLVISEYNLEKELNRSLTDAWGIGGKIADKLKKLGINSLLDLKNYDFSILKRSLGVYGYYLWANVNGLEISDIRQSVSDPKSIGHSYCLPQKTQNKEYLLKILLKLCEKTGRRLRSSGLEAGSVNIYLAYSDGNHINKAFRCHEKIFTTLEIFDPLEAFIKKTEIIMPVRMLAVSVSKLSAFSGQLSFFSDRQRERKLSRAMDAINDRYGEYAVKNGLLIGVEGQAHDRVGFRKTISIQRED